MNESTQETSILGEGVNAALQLLLAALFLRRLFPGAGALAVPWLGAGWWTYLLLSLLFLTQAAIGAGKALWARRQRDGHPVRRSAGWDAAMYAITAAFFVVLGVLWPLQAREDAGRVSWFDAVLTLLLLGAAVMQIRRLIRARKNTNSNENG